MRRLALVLLLAAAPARAADGAGAQVLEHKGRWESGYGAQFYNVVGRLRNTSGHELRYVKLRIEALDEQGNVVAKTETYNESAEALAVPDLNPRELLESGKVKPLPADAEERFRGSFLKEETPAFTDYRVKVIETPEVTPAKAAEAPEAPPVKANETPQVPPKSPSE
ncbi:MAG TPA: FxLYD domain-containing protein [Verrucomicrobiae bacterium]|nr:FxLYD domain-containing protein [Verrucomicrobiae bacterium]